MLQLIVNNRLFGGWTSASITRGIKQVASTFSLSLTDRWEEAQWLIKPFDECELIYEGRTVLTGYIDNVSISYDEGQHSISVSGRSKTGDLVDCSVETKQFNNQAFISIVDALIPEGYGIHVETDIYPDTSKNFITWKPDEGVTVFEAIEKLARLRGLLLTDNAFGNLMITRAGKGKAPARLELGKNIKSASATYDVKDRFSKYTVKGQQRGNDDATPEVSAHVQASVADKNMPEKRYRPLILTAEDQTDFATAKTRIEWESNIRWGNSQTYTVEVVGWSANGQLWQPNATVQLTDEFLNIDTEKNSNLNLLITTVKYDLNESGTTATLTLQPREAFLVEPQSGQESEQPSAANP